MPVQSEPVLALEVLRLE
jgi:hypothetical protein